MPSTFEATAGQHIGVTNGASVVQLTNKSTAVTANVGTGRIVMNGALLGTNSEVTFQVVNSTVSPTDVILVNHVSGGTVGAYLAQANEIAAGSFKITVLNLTTGNLSEAIALRFLVFKSADS